MRSEEFWNEKVRLKRIQDKFPPRIQADLLKLPIPTIPDKDLLGIYIFAMPGFGKTIYAAQLLLEQEKRWYLAGISGKAYFVNCSDLLNEIRACFDNKEKSEKDILRQYRDCDFLVLDDFGADRVTDWVYQTFYLLINSRYENLKTTIFTSNFSLAEVGKTWGDCRITSRVERMGIIKKKNKYK